MAKKKQRMAYTSISKSPPHPLMEQLSAAFAQKSVNAAAAILTQLFTNFPTRWREIWLINSGLPQPGGSTPKDTARYLEYAKFLMDSTASVTSTPLLAERTKFIEVLAAGSALNSLMHLNISSLPALHHWKLSRRTRTFRVAAFLESQHYIAENLLVRYATGQGIFNPESLAHAETRTQTGVSTNLQTGIDSRVESTDLVLRYDFHNHKNQEWGSFDPTAMVYHDPDFSDLVFLSELWRVHQDVWATVMYRGYGVSRATSSAIVIGPTNDEDFRRAAAGVYRSRDIDAGFSSIDIVSASTSCSDTPARLEALAASITIPPSGECWNAIVDTNLLAECSLATTHSRHCWLELERLHCLPIIEDHLRIGPTGSEVEYTLWDRVLDTLRVLAKAITLAVRKQVLEPGGLECFRTVQVVRADDLVRVLHASCDSAPLTTVARCVQILTFSASRRHLELWDQPLLPFGDGMLLLLPQVISSGNPCRALENFIDEWRASDFDRRGAAFERHIAAQLANTHRLEIDSKVHFRENNQLEVDILGVWEGRIVLFECKCLKAVYSPADEFRANEAIKYAVEQLTLRRTALIDDWDRLQKTIPLLDGVIRPADATDIYCVVVTNVLGFSGLVKDGIVVADEMMLFRYFGDNEYTIDLSTSSRGMMFRGVMPSTVTLNRGPDELMTYLRDPPQVRRVLDGLRTSEEVIGGISNSIQVKRVIPDFSSVRRLASPEEIAKLFPQQEMP